MKIAKRILVYLLAVVMFCSAAAFFYYWFQGKRNKNQPRLFGATYMTMNNPYFDVLNESISDVVEANGDILITRDPSREQEKQNEQILKMIDEGISVLFLNPVDWKDVGPSLDACEKAGVAVINIDTLVYDIEKVLCAIESDNYDAGVQCAEDMMGKKKKADIVILESKVTDSITQRVEGFLDTIKPYENYKVIYTDDCEGELEISQQVMGDFLKKELSFDVIFGGNDPTALGALAALQKHQKEDYVLIYGVDGSPDFKAMLEIGYVEGTSAQSPKTIGITAAEIAYRYLEGEENIPVYIDIPVRLITKDNLDHKDVYEWQ